MNPIETLLREATDHWQPVRVQLTTGRPLIGMPSFLEGDEGSFVLIGYECDGHDYTIDDRPMTYVNLAHVMTVRYASHDERSNL